ncbi:hypothetical protein DV515_00003143 [Chloebia gouldiae]|uniref:Uncharacterized protein n=1 Tax=Chloebia gouldiae TaxID=44316 RepID=A0A3L8STT1_CHLGU|nr:hypothetical protein DV515_00003143 [Chloebia gouldiae]
MLLSRGFIKEALSWKGVGLLRAGRQRTAASEPLLQERVSGCVFYSCARGTRGWLRNAAESVWLAAVSKRSSSDPHSLRSDRVGEFAMNPVLIDRLRVPLAQYILGSGCQGVVPGRFQGSARHFKAAPLQRLGTKSLTAGFEEEKKGKRKMGEQEGNLFSGFLAAPIRREEINIVKSDLFWQRGGGRVVVSAEEVAGLVYMAFIDGLSYQGSGNPEAMLAATRNSLSLAQGSTSAAKHSAGHLSLHQQHSDPATEND